MVGSCTPPCGGEGDTCATRPGRTLQRPTVFAMHVVADDPGGLLAVRIDEFGWAFALEIDRPLRRRLVDRLGEATAEEMEAVDNALRATFKPDPVSG